MGRYSNSNFGDISGKVGNAIGSKWRGVKYMRGLPSKSNKKATESQLAVQARLALSVDRLRPLKGVIKIGFGDKKIHGMTGYNRAVRDFISYAIQGEHPSIGVNYERLQLSRATGLGALVTPEVAFVDAFVVSWTVAEDEIMTFAQDRVMVVVYNETTNLYFIDYRATRSLGTATVAVSALPGDVLHTWVFCAESHGLMTSATQYLGYVSR